MDAALDLSTGQMALYQPLDETKREVRFMRFTKSADSTLEFEVKAFSLDDEPDYIALSYCWTEAKATEKILLNNQTFWVRANLYGFLQQMGKASREWVFIDAICINQSSLDERSQQVRLMRDIYASAAEVVVWLGCCDFDITFPYARDDMADYYASKLEIPSNVDTFETWLDKIFPERFQSCAAWVIHAAAETDATNDSRDLVREDALTLIRPFLGIEYWSRTWIIQEVMLARCLSFRLQNVSLSEALFFSLLKIRRGADDPELIPGFSSEEMSQFSYPALFNSDVIREDLPFKAELAAYQLLLKRSQFRGTNDQCVYTMPLYEALTVFAWHDCALARDKIFGVIGLSPSVLRADYKMPKLELATRVICESFLRLRSKDTLESSVSTVIALLGTILAAAQLDFDHPTVTVTLEAICGVLNFPAIGSVIEMLYRLRDKTSRTSGVRVISKTRRRRLLRFCSRYKSDTRLLPVDETGPETLASRQHAVVSTVGEVFFRITLFDGSVPEGLPPDPRIRPILEGLINVMEKHPRMVGHIPPYGGLPMPDCTITDWIPQ